jgi:D-3-phosphoglycerate dehydrogenase
LPFWSRASDHGTDSCVSGNCNEYVDSLTAHNLHERERRRPQDMKALILAPFDPSVLRNLRQTLDVTYESWMDTKKLLSPHEFVQRIQEQGMDIVVVEADFLPREVFEEASGLRLLGVCRADVSHIDMAAAAEHGVPVVNTPARNAIAVAELTIGLMLCLARRIPAAHTMVQSGQWTDPTVAYFHMRGSELWGKTIGIIGFGAIGQQVARRLAAFDASTRVYDPYVAPERIGALGAVPSELDDLMKESDFVTVHCSTTAETVGLLNARRIALMKSTAYLVNAASAYVVDEDAIASALRDKRIAGAAFDVYKDWPVKPDDPLLKLSNVVLTPHIGGATDESVTRHSLAIADDIHRFLRGERPRNLVNPQVWK